MDALENEIWAKAAEMQKKLHPSETQAEELQQTIYWPTQHKASEAKKQGKREMTPKRKIGGTGGDDYALATFRTSPPAGSTRKTNGNARKCHESHHSVSLSLHVFPDRRYSAITLKPYGIANVREVYMDDFTRSRCFSSVLVPFLSSNIGNVYSRLIVTSLPMTDYLCWYISNSSPCSTIMDMLHRLPPTAP